MNSSEKIEYDGYYLIDVVTKSGHKSIISTRGYKLKSWINFEKSLGSEYSYRKVTEKEYMKYDWMGVPYEEEPKKKSVKKTIEKPIVKKVAKKTAKKTPAKKTVKKSTSKSKNK